MWEPKEITEGKGLHGQNCNVTSCQEPNSAFYYNNQMKRYYCWECATEIERFANLDGMSFFEDLPKRKPKVIFIDSLASYAHKEIVKVYEREEPQNCDNTTPTKFDKPFWANDWRKNKKGRSR